MLKQCDGRGTKSTGVGTVDGVIDRAVSEWVGGWVSTKSSRQLYGSVMSAFRNTAFTSPSLILLACLLLLLLLLFLDQTPLSIDDGPLCRAGAVGGDRCLATGSEEQKGGPGHEEEEQRVRRVLTLMNFFHGACDVYALLAVWVVWAA